jgi:hypothetical protein
MSGGIPVLFSETEVYYVDLISSPTKTHKKIVWLNVSMEKRFGMDKFHSVYLQERDRDHLKIIM